MTTLQIAALRDLALADLTPEQRDTFLAFALPHTDLADARILHETVAELMDRVETYGGVDNGADRNSPDAEDYYQRAQRAVLAAIEADDDASPEAAQRRAIAAALDERHGRPRAAVQR